MELKCSFPLNAALVMFGKIDMLSNRKLKEQSIKA
jgi:hypothetical protein